MQADQQDVMHALQELTNFTTRVEMLELELKASVERRGVLVPHRFVQDDADKRIAALELKVEKLTGMLEITWDMMETPG